jgi:hypothetical protein
MTDGLRHTRQHVTELQARLTATRPGMAPSGNASNPHLAVEHSYGQHDYTWGLSRRKWAHVIPVIEDEPDVFLETPKPKRRKRSIAEQELLAEQERRIEEAVQAVHKVAEPPKPLYPVSEPLIPADVVSHHRRKHRAKAAKKAKQERKAVSRNRVSKDPRLSMDDLLEILGDEWP